jgi:hypothetical protein
MYDTQVPETPFFFRTRMKKKTQARERKRRQARRTPPQSTRESDLLRLHPPAILINRTPRPIPCLPPGISTPPPDIMLGLLIRRLSPRSTTRHLAATRLSPPANNMQSRNRRVASTSSPASATSPTAAPSPTTRRNILLVLPSLALAPPTDCLAQTTLSCFREARAARSVFVGCLETGEGGVAAGWTARWCAGGEGCRRQ